MTNTTKDLIQQKENTLLQQFNEPENYREYYYKGRNQYFQGRLLEKNQLASFQDENQYFAIMNVHGEGGSGKSALLYNYIYHRLDEDDDDWHYAFISCDELAKLDYHELTSLDYHLFLVVDYLTTSHDMEIVNLIEQLTTYGYDEYSYNIRFVFLERNSTISNRWYHSLKKKLSDELMENLQNEIILNTLSTVDIASIIIDYGKDESIVDEVVRRMKGTTKILYALILTDMVKHHEDKDPLEYVYDREKERILNLTKSEELLERTLRWLAQATLLGQRAYDPTFNIPKLKRRMIVSALNGKEDCLYGVEPDMIGEYLVIQYLNEYEDDYHHFLSPLWKEDGDSLVTSFIHIMQDFKEDPIIDAAFTGDVSSAHHRLLKYASYEPDYAKKANELLAKYYEWYIMDDTLLEYNGTHTKVTLPDEVKKISRTFDNRFVEIDFNQVREIEEYAFEGDLVLEKAILRNIKVIEPYTFSHAARLQTINLGIVEQIKDHAFTYSQIKELDFPPTLKSIGEYAFYKASQIEYIDLANIETIHTGAFRSAKIMNKELVFPSSLKEIGDYAFRNSLNLDRLTLMEVEKLGNFSFEDCTINKLIFESPISMIPMHCFSNDQIKEIIFHDDIQYIDRGAFSGNSLTEVVLPKGLIELDEYAFSHGKRKFKVYINDRLQKIGQFAFSNIDELNLNHSMEILLPQNACTLNLTGGIYTFKEGKSELVIDATFFKRPFHKSGRIHLWDLMKDNEDVEIEEDIFYLNPQSRKQLRDPKRKKTITKLVIEKGIHRIYSHEFENCTHLKEVVWNDEINYIGVNAFMSTNIQEIIFPSSLRVIQDGAFAHTPLKHIVFNEGLEKIGDDMARIAFEEDEFGAFEGCKIHRLSFPSSIKQIGKYSFKDNHELAYCDLSNVGLTALEDYIFAYCMKLTDIQLPDTLKIMKEGCLTHCKLSQISLPEGLEIIGEKSLGFNPLLSITFPHSLLEIKDRAFSRCRFERFTISHKVMIGKNIDLKNLKEVVIYDYPFHDVDKLNKLSKQYNNGYYFTEDTLTIKVRNENFDQIMKRLEDSSKSSISALYKKIQATT